MSLLHLYKLEKLKITPYRDANRTVLADVLPFEAMFNPASLEQKYCIPWARRQSLNGSSAELKYAGSRPQKLSISLVLDGTGAHELGVFALRRKSVTQRVNDLFAVVYRFNGVIHQPNFLRLEWGDLSFDGRLSSVDVKYTSFHRDGTPLRAELGLSFLEDIPAHVRARLEAKTSPDLTHTRTVRSGDTLPLLTTEIYGTPAFYLDVARFNGLDDFRTLVPGQELHFPPLVVLTRARAGEG